MSVSSSKSEFKPILQASNGKFLKGTRGGPGRPAGVKAQILELVEDGQIWKWLVEVAQGKPVIPTLPDGRQGPPVTFSGPDILAARVYLANAAYGKPVGQTDILAAELAQREHAKLAAMTDEQIAQLAKAYLGEEDAQIVDTVQEALPGTVPEGDTEDK